ncbi:cytochrome-c peroxidase [Deinococcus pimensis]|uniref:cytochrome-c peroxidase n=1 Tax=Deinococcus pimensis TaxID=309888 RepID=UPI000487CD44|nr:cytochrome c peroxidase [Deinococcus pimensis]
MRTPACTTTTRAARHALTLTIGLLLLNACSTNTTSGGATEPAPVEALGVKDVDRPLNLVPLPVIGGIGDVNYNDRTQLAKVVLLGKALFWDQQVGEYREYISTDPLTKAITASGVKTGMACASCHFSAGADNRGVNNTVSVTVDGLTSQVKSVGSEGVPKLTYNGRYAADGKIPSDVTTDTDDVCTSVDTSPRQITGAQAPSAIIAGYNYLQFWNGRAHNNFNGLNPFGSTANGGDTVFDSGQYTTNSSLASQANGPANSDVEMTCAGRDWSNLGWRLRNKRVLAKQDIDPNDSVLGQGAVIPNVRNLTYYDLVANVYGLQVAVNPNTWTNFGRLWGQAVQAYERSLNSDQTPLDKYLAGASSALNLDYTSTRFGKGNALRGFGVFKGKGSCTDCHSGPELTDASVNFVLVKGLINEDGGDQGFHDINSFPEQADAGRASTGPKGVTFSETMRKDPTNTADVGAHKTAPLRNVGLTAPYFAHGNADTLEDVVEFYNSAGTILNGQKVPWRNARLASRLKQLSLGTQDKADLVAFLKLGLTDDRAARDAAPFDHPSLTIPGGSVKLIDATGKFGRPNP